MLEKFQVAISPQPGGVFGDGGSNGAIFESNKFKMAAAAILDNFEWPYPQRLTIYLYSAHRAVIFAIAQLSCYMIHPSDRQTDALYHIHAIAYMLSRVKMLEDLRTLDSISNNTNRPNNELALRHCKKSFSFSCLIF